ncbi:MAG: dihydroneopterin aldolase [Clostridiales bacterium]|nr:dihydroneopterin aldolase [Clostridiales bacterium]
MDKILMNDMIFYAYHGVLKEEKTLGQRFIVTIELILPLRKAGESDNVIDTVSYADVYEDVKKIMNENKFNLIEKLVEEISSVILAKYLLVSEIKVKVLKPDAPVNGVYHSFGVEICRKR